MKQRAITIVLLGLVLGFAIYKVASGNGSTPTTAIQPNNNVSLVDGKQVIEVVARGGYSPRKTTAKAGMPTILRMSTNGSYDCSVALRIPKLGIAKNLEPTGTTDIDLGTPGAGVLRGICGMGMYSFEIDFKA
jgi:plastocyanin domain-containing protein